MGNNEIIEKAKQWQVGDEQTDKHGVTYYVHALNAAGKPLWRKKKDSGANANTTTSTASSDSSNLKIGDSVTFVHHGKKIKGIITYINSGISNVKTSDGYNYAMSLKSLTKIQASSTGRGNNSVKNSSSKQAVDIVLTNEDYDRVFHNVGLSRQTLFEHNNKPYILKIFGKRFDGSYIISVHNGDTEKKLQGDSNIAISVKRAFINQLKQEKLREIERNAKKKQAKSTDDTQSDDKVKPSSKKKSFGT